MRIAKAWRIGAAVVVAAVLALGGFAVYRAQSQQETVVTVNGQGIPVGFYNDMQTRQAELSARYPGYPQHFGDINNLIDQVLIDQEAQRRGIACSPQDAANYIATQVANFTEAGNLPDFLGNADVFGVVPPGWIKTPEPERTPALAVALATYVVNPSVLLTYQNDICTRGNLMSAVITPGATNDQRNAAIDALLAQLRAAAHITGSTVPVDSPTPSSPIATDTPLPPTATATP